MAANNASTPCPLTPAPRTATGRASSAAMLAGGAGIMLGVWSAGVGQREWQVSANGNTKVRFRLVGRKNPSADSCESFGRAHHGALGQRLALAEAAELGEGANQRLLQQHEAGAGDVTEVGRMLEIVVDGHRERGFGFQG